MIVMLEMYDSFWRNEIYNSYFANNHDINFFENSDVLIGRSVKTETGNKILNMSRQSHQLSDIVSGKRIKTNFLGFLWFS